MSRNEAKRALMLYKRKARAAVQDAGPLSPKSQRRQDEFDEMRILLLQNQLLLSKEKEEEVTA